MSAAWSRSKHRWPAASASASAASPKFARRTAAGTINEPASKDPSSTQAKLSGNRASAPTVGTHEFKLRGRLLHHAFDHGDDNHQHRAANTAAGHAADDGLNVEAA